MKNTRACMNCCRRSSSSDFAGSVSRHTSSSRSTGSWGWGPHPARHHHVPRERWVRWVIQVHCQPLHLRQPWQTTRSTSALVERKWCVCVLLALHFGIRSWHVRPAAKHEALEAGGASMILKIQKIVMVGDKHPTTNPHHQQLLQ